MDQGSLRRLLDQGSRFLSPLPSPLLARVESLRQLNLSPDESIIQLASKQASS